MAGKNPESVGADEDDFIKVTIKNNNGSWETEFSEELGLPGGTYELEYFIVYSADDQVLWVAPREGGAYASSVSDPLPQEIVLIAGSKPYIEVDVLCFVPRMEEAFGYIFFDINLIAVENNYCIFVNFCDDETGREYPALFQVDVWADAFGGTDLVIDGEMNTVSGTGNNFSATVLCLVLPPLEGADTYFVRVTVLTAGAYTADAADVREFTISQADINAQLLDTPRYEHLRINCGEDDGNGGDDCATDSTGAQCDPDNDNLTNAEEEALGTNPNNPDTDGDGRNDDVDNCPLAGKTPGQVETNLIGCWEDPDQECTTVITCDIGDDPASGCEFTFIEGNAGDDVFVKVNSNADVFNLKNALNDQIGELTTAFDGEGDLVVTINNNEFDEFISKYEIEVHPADEAGDMITTCQDMACDSDVAASTVSIDVEMMNDVVTEYPFYIRVKATACFPL